jgi:hypothetical protein
VGAAGILSTRFHGDVRAWRRFLLRLVLFLALLLAVDRGLATLLHAGLERYFGLHAPAEVLLIGHSHTMLGVDHELLARELELPVAKYARQGASLAERQVMIRQFFDRHPGSTRVVIYDVEAALFNPAGLSANSYRLLLPFSDEPAVADFLHSQELPPMSRLVWRHLKASRFDEVTVGLAARGLLGDWRSFKTGVIDATRLKRLTAPGVYRPISFDPRQVELLRETIRNVRNQGATIVLAFYPTIDVYNRIEPARFSEARQLFAELAAEDPGVVYLEYLEGYAERHELFYDPIHLNREGQRMLTRHLAADLRDRLHRTAYRAVDQVPPGLERRR